MTKKSKASKRAALAAVKAPKSVAASIAAKPKKKKKSSFLSLLSGAAKVAAELAPVLLPALVGSHGPTRSALAASPSTSGMVGLAEPASIQPMTGLTNMSPIIQDGKVVGVTLTGIDFIGSINNPSGYSEGAVIKEVDLSVRSADWSGTRLQRESTLYERFNFKHLCMIYEPTCPATTAGQVIGYVDTDPAETFTEVGRAAVQVASAHVGAEVNQVWQMGVAQYYPDARTSDFYADAEGSDIRLTSPGTYRCIAATSIGGEAGPLGNLYACYQVELKVPQLEESTAEGAAVTWAADSTTSVSAAAPFGNGDSSILTPSDPNTIPQAYWFPNAGGAESGFTGIPPGTYWIIFGAAATTITTATISETGSGYSLTQLWSSSASGVTAYTMYLLVVDDSAVPEVDYLTFSFATLSSVSSYPKVWLVRVPSNVSIARKMTLQQYEKHTSDLLSRVSELESLMRDVTSVSRRQLEEGGDRAAVFSRDRSSTLHSSQIQTKR